MEKYIFNKADEWFLTDFTMDQVERWILHFQTILDQVERRILHLQTIHRRGYQKDSKGAK